MESANTRRLLEIAENSGKPCVIVQSAGEIPKEFFLFDRIGLCAGASSPDAVIDEIEKRLTF
jgi:4-hydroxy-3-methylbut-2-enyl diphosphate reductase